MAVEYGSGICTECRKKYPITSWPMGKGYLIFKTTPDQFAIYEYSSRVASCRVHCNNPGKKSPRNTRL